MIYKAIFCFERIEICNVQETYVHPDRGFWLQHNPRNNLLAIMSTSQQVYHEARQIFYLYNTFTFHQRFAVPIFLIGIGRENALRLKSVEWRLGDDDQFENHIDIVKSRMLRERDQTQTQSEEEINCWDDEEQFVEMERTIVVPYMLPYQFRDARLRPLDADEDVPDDGFGRRYRFVFIARFHEHGESMRHGKAGYEMMKLRISRPHSD
ncbi:hypothetical protein EIK77_003878 [Talaromyces pinophilus]|nr:hypothetical protein EIK77_003878 [Talaromyces pinophilus]